MEFLKSLFEQAENGTMTYEQLKQACSEANIKLANLSEGAYVSRKKYDDDIKERDESLQAVQEQLTQTAGDSEQLKAVQAALAELQQKHSAQTYEFSVREFANTKRFTSNAAKRDFISSMVKKGLQIENGRIIGAEDFVAAYSADNSDAFVVDKPIEQQKKAPQFVGPTTPAPETTITKAQFDRMSYAQRNELYNTNRELYNQLKG